MECITLSNFELEEYHIFLTASPVSYFTDQPERKIQKSRFKDCKIPILKEKTKTLGVQNTLRLYKETGLFVESAVSLGHGSTFLT